MGGDQLNECERFQQDKQLTEFAEYLWNLWRKSGQPWFENMPPFKKLAPPSPEGKGRTKLTFYRFAKSVWDEVLCEDCRE